MLKYIGLILFVGCTKYVQPSSDYLPINIKVHTFAHYKTNGISIGFTMSRPDSVFVDRIDLVRDSDRQICWSTDNPSPGNYTAIDSTSVKYPSLSDSVKYHFEGYFRSLRALVVERSFFVY